MYIQTDVSNGVGIVCIRTDGVSADACEPPVFETVIRGGPRDGERYTWHSWDEAARGHGRIVATVQYPDFRPLGF